ncbi:hypothetical protein LWI28_007424 [Acer negundo]|uniref:BLISTER n=1 Tax=Acer negundo TaxID=4023 RepID=A0AAD5P1C8_ACENE|nr:hypothetical protein LWI28_007424 [Acer negundo]
MASAQVLSTSRKQEHLEAGKRRLEEFRKKKAAERAKKSTSVSQSHASDVNLHDKPHLEADHARVTDSDGVGTSDGSDKAVTGPTLVLDNDDYKSTGLSMQNQQGSLNDTHSNPPSSVNDLNSSSIDLVRTYSNNQDIRIYAASGSAEQLGANNSLQTKDVNNDFVHSMGQGRPQYGSTPDQLFGLRPQASQDYDSSSSKSSFQGIEEPRLKDKDSFFKVPAVNPDSSNMFAAQISPQNSVSTLLQSNLNTASSLGNGRTFYSSFEDSTQPTSNARGSVLEVGKNMQGVVKSSFPAVSDSEETKLSSSTGGFPSLYNGPVQTSKSSGFSFDVTNSSNHVPVHSSTNEFTSRRSRPSFLDSLDIPRAPSGSPFQRSEPQKESFMSNSSELNSVDVLGSSFVQKPSSETGTMGPFSKSITPSAPSVFNHVGNSPVSVNNGADLLRTGTNENSKEMHGFYSTKQNEDFSALEQHIEDLTQEKFSLQRSLEASRALAESLASENSSMTDSYNQQRSVVNQLKSDMENLQEEIKAQLVELESFRNEYANVRLECNAADERAKILASEVIGMEEKALRLRSSELKLERQLENSQAEISSYKKKVSSLEKDRQDLQLTIDALQEEKKVLQSKVRKTSGSMKSIDVNKNPSSRKDVSTSTEDLDTGLNNSNNEVHDNTSSLEIDASGLPLLPENGLLAHDVSAVNIPPDQMRIIQNINALVSELSLEKEELMQALSSELSQSSKLKDLNKELSRKLEAQTQRLELLTAQNMATENVSTRQPDSHIAHDNLAYADADADEGDEVVERVLGWIMKLFPGGPPSRRRTSKLL